MTTKAETKIFKFVHPVSGDIFWYIDKKHQYLFWENKGKVFKEEDMIELAGTTTPLKLVNPLSWDNTGKMIDMGSIFQMGAIKKVVNFILDKTKVGLFNGKQIEEICIEAKKKPKESFEDAGLSGTEIHALIEAEIKNSILNTGGQMKREWADQYDQQVKNFVLWACDNKVKFLFSEEPIYSKEWMNCGTVDFICEIDGKILIGDIKTNGDKRRFEWDAKKSCYNFSKPQSNIDVKALWQTGCYGKMVTEGTARKLIDKFDGVVIVNVMKSGQFDTNLDVRYDYAIDSLIRAYEHVLGLYKEFRRKI
jgi:hypothetical protein